ncbi:Protein NCBP2AS2 [Trichinella pseudospiralis]
MLKRLVYQLLNNEDVIRKISDSWPVRRIAQLSAYSYLNFRRQIWEVMQHQIKADTIKMKIENPKSALNGMKNRFFIILKDEWEKVWKNFR